MIWCWCKYCERWFLTYTTTVTRCGKCGAEVFDFAYQIMPNELMEGEEDE